MPATHLREAVRSLRRDPLFTALAVGLLAVSIGAVMAVHATVYAVILRPLPFADQERLVVVWQRDDRRALPVVEVAYGEMLDWRARASRVLEDLAVVGSTNWSLELIGRDGTESLALAPVSASFFSVAGTSPAIGRAFEPSDEDGPLPHAMVISHGLWTRRFGPDGAVRVEHQQARSRPAGSRDANERDREWSPQYHRRHCAAIGALLRDDTGVLDESSGGVRPRRGHARVGRPDQAGCASARGRVGHRGAALTPNRPHATVRATGRQPC